MTLDGERAVSHFFVSKRLAEDVARGTLSKSDVPVIPQSVELVNQTVSVPREPIKEKYLWRQIVEYRNLQGDARLKADFENAIRRYTQMRAKQQEDRQRLKVTEIKSTEHQTQENKILLRIAREKGIDVMRLIGDEYQPLKDQVGRERMEKYMQDIETNFFAE